MENAALEFIKAIASNMPEVNKPLSAILEALEDGEALAYLGVTDDDLNMVEEAHAMVSDWIKDGKRLLGESSPRTIYETTAFLAGLMGVDPHALKALSVSGQPFEWNGVCVVVLARDTWIELFDVATGEMLISVAVPGSGAARLVRRPAGDESRGWRRFTTEPAPLGFYHKNNRIAHLLKR